MTCQVDLAAIRSLQHLEIGLGLFTVYNKDFSWSMDILFWIDLQLQSVSMFTDCFVLLFDLGGGRRSNDSVV